MDLTARSMKSKSKHKLRFEAIGTQWLVETDQPVSGELNKRIADRIELFDRTYSRFRDDSLVSEIARKAGEYDFPADAENMVAFYKQLYEATDGVVSPLVGDMLVAAGYDMNYSFTQREIGNVPSWDEVMEWHGATVTMKRMATLDFGAAGKGYLVDIISGMLVDAGHDNYTIDASGDVCTRGSVEKIGLENPYDPESVIGVMEVKNASLCASAMNRRAWGKWHHVVDPRTLKPVSDVVATWVCAPTTLEADGLSTALFFVAPEKLTDWHFTYVRLLADGRIEHSPDFVGELFT